MGWEFHLLGPVLGAWGSEKVCAEALSKPCFICQSIKPPCLHLETCFLSCRNGLFYYSQACIYSRHHTLLDLLIFSSSLLSYDSSGDCSQLHLIYAWAVPG